MQALSRGRAFLVLAMACAAPGWGQQVHFPGAEVVTIPSAGNLHAPFSAQFSALDSFLRGASPQKGTRRNLTGLATWTVTSSPPGAVTINSTTGLATAVDFTSCAVGCPATITATLGRLQGAINVTVYAPASIAITNVSASQPNPLPQGEFQQFKATASYGDGALLDVTSNVMWNSNNPAAIAIDSFGFTSHGLAEAVGTSGSANIGCALGPSSCATPFPSLTAGQPVLVSVFATPRDPVVAKGGNITFFAQGFYSHDATPVSITSISRSGCPNCVVMVTTSSAHNLKPLFQVDIAGVSDPSFNGRFQVATVGSPTAFTYAQPGLSNATPSGGSPTAATSQHTLPFGSGCPSNPCDTATWAVTGSSQGGGATINASTGVAMGTADGIVQISAMPFINGASAPNTCLQNDCIANLNVDLQTLMAITPANPSVPRGSNAPLAARQLRVMGSFVDATPRDVTDSVAWTSNFPKIVSVITAPPSPLGAAPGLVTALGSPAQSATITAQILPPQPSCPSALCVQTTVTVAPPVLFSIAVTPASPTILFGNTKQFTATGTNSDGSKLNLTSTAVFTSSDPSVLAFLSSATPTPGLGTTGPALGATATLGSANVTAAMSSITSPIDVVTVSQAVIESIKVTPKNPSVAINVQQQFTATGTYTDDTKCTFPACSGDAKHAAASVSWTSQDPPVASIDSSGLATVNTSSGTARIVATSGAVQGSTILTATPPTLKSIAISPTTPAELPVGGVQQFTATGTFTDGSMEDVTGSVTWKSSNPAVTIDSNGLATGKSIGSASISATSGSITSNTVSLTVLALNSITVFAAPCPSPFTSCTSSAAINFGATQSFVAIGTLSDSTSEDITASVDAASGWSTSDSTVATIDQTGLATGTGDGTASIIAQLGAVSSAGPSDGVLTVQVLLQSIDVEPASATVPFQGTQQYTATGNYADGSQQDLSLLVTWSTLSNGVVASIDPSGLLTGSGPGQDTVTALCPTNGACPGVPTGNPPVSASTPVTVSF